MSQRPAWDEMFCLGVKNITDAPMKIRVTMPIAIPPLREVEIQARSSVGINMQFGSTIEINGIVIGPVTEER